MAAFNEDEMGDEASRGGGGRGAGGGGMGREDSWDVEEPDERDLVPDEMATVKCTHCGKYIFEDTARCPYCSHMQLDSERDRRPMWFILTALVCVGAMGGVMVARFFGLWPW